MYPPPSLVAGILLVLISSVQSCATDIKRPSTVKIEASLITNEIIFDSMHIDGAEFLYDTENEHLIFMPYGADFIYCQKDDGSFTKIEGFVGEGPNKIPSIWHYGYASDTSVFLYGEPKYVVYSLEGEFLQYGKLDVSQSMPASSIQSYTHLGSNGEIIFASMSTNFVGDQKAFVKYSHTISCMDLSDKSWYHTGYLDGNGIYAKNQYEYDDPILDIVKDTIYALYPNDPYFVYKFACNGDSYEPKAINIPRWEAPMTGIGNNSIGYRLEEFQQNTSFLQFFATEDYFYTVQIMPAEGKRISKNIEDIQDNSHYRKRFLNIFPTSGAHAILSIDLGPNWAVAAVLPNGNLLLCNSNNMDGVSNFILSEYDWRKHLDVL